MRRAQLLTTATILISLGTAGTAAAQSDKVSAGNAAGKDTRQATAEASKAGDQLRESNKRQQAAQNTGAGGETPPIILMRDWGYDRIYGEGWSARNLLDDASVYGPDGDEMGSVENLIIDRNGKLLGIVAEVGGFIDIGDTHVFVPWDQVQLSDELKRVTLPVTEENIESYSMSPDGYLQKSETGARRVVDDDLSSGQRIWKASDLLGDEAVLNGMVGYGHVDDLVFTSDARLHAVVVNSYAGFRGNYRAFPFYGYPYGWAPWYPAYHLGYDRDDVVNLQVLDYDEIRSDRAERAAGAGKQNGTSGTTGSAPADRQEQQSNKGSSR